MSFGVLPTYSPLSGTRIQTALSLLHAALEGGTKMDVHRLRAECMVGIGDVVLRRGDAMQAKAMWKKAHPLFLRSRRMKDAVSVQERLQRFGESVETLSVPVVILSPLIE
jgi:hypothetical protein